MWVFTETGFISAVVDNPDSNMVKVRARDEESLHVLAKESGTNIIKTPNADYPYRVVISREEFTEFLIRAVEFLDYSNFKSHVHTTRGSKFAQALSKVWSTMHDVEDEGARKNSNDH